jgi:hypothetical protein
MMGRRTAHGTRGLGKSEARNSKSEYRNPKQNQMFEMRMAKTKEDPVSLQFFSDLEHYRFDIVSDF